MGLYIKTICVSLFLILTSCGGSSSNSDTTTPPPVEPSYNIEGISSKGPIAEATINIYRIESDGSRGELAAGPYTTNEDGTWSTDDDLPSGGPFEVVSTGGYYLDEVTDTEVVIGNDNELSGIIVSSDSDIEVAITPLTHAALITAKHSIANFGMSASDAIRHAIGDMQSSLGFDVTTTLPPAIDDLSSTTSNQKLYTAILGGISELSTDTDIADVLSGASKFDIAIAIAKDISDGKLDGFDINGSQITVNVDDTPLDIPVLDANGITPLNEATNTFADATEGLESTSINNNTELAMGCHGTQALNDSVTFGIDGDGFFLVNLNGEEFVTRYGSHCLSSDGKIKSANGGFLQGFPVNSNGNVTSSTPQTIQLFADPYNIDDLTSIEVDSDGNITVNYQDSNSVIVSRISVIVFPSTAQLGELDNPYCFETYSSGLSIAMMPGHAGAGTIDQTIDDFSSFTDCYGGSNIEHTISFAGDSYLRYTNSEDGRVMYVKDAVFMLDSSGYIIYGNQPKNIVFKDGKWINDIEVWRLNGISETEPYTLSYLVVPTGVSNPSATTEIALGANIDAGESSISAAIAFDPSNPSSYNHSTSTTIFDSQGGSHQAHIYFRKTATNTWQLYLYIGSYAVRPENYTGIAPNDQTYITLNFDQFGSLSTIVDNGNVWNEIEATEFSPFALPGKADLDIKLDLSSLTQYAINFSVNSLEQDGYAAGEFSGLSINSQGEILATFANNQTGVIGLIAAANFENPDLLIAGELGFFDPGETAIITTVSAAGDEVISTL